MDHRELTSAVFERVVQKVDDVGAANLPWEERVVCRVIWLRAAVDNGGFASFFYNSEADYATETIEALVTIGATEVAQLVRQAISVFPSLLGRTMDERNDRWDELPPEADETFDGLDDAFHELEPSLEAKLADFIRKHASLLL